MEHFRSPAFQTYVNDFLGSAKVRVMTTAEFGAYWFLLFLDWQEGGFTYDEPHLAEWCKMTQPQFKRAWERILHRCFIGHDGRLWNPRLERERVKQLAWREKSASGGRKGAATRWGLKGKESESPNPGEIDGDGPPPLSGQPIPVARVLAAYVELHPRRKTTGDGPRRIVLARLKEFTADELIEALKGNAADPWHKEKSKHELGYVLRNVDKVNEFRAKYHQQANPRLIGVGGDYTAEDVQYITSLERK